MRTLTKQQAPRPTAVAGRSIDVPSDAPHLVVPAHDPEASAEWWCDTLGFELVCPQPPVGRERQIRHPDSGLVIALPKASSAGLGRAPYLSLRVASREALDGWAARFGELGVPHSEVRDNDEGRFLTLSGPEGIGLELWWPSGSSD
jgi:catechol 2,3-dioxygenase-like lactoylglutathione lyase family enzyme